MEFIGPDPGDLKDVRALNRAFLEYLGGEEGEALRRELPASLGLALPAMSQNQVERLAGVPFLLLSFCETDETYWDKRRPVASNDDLFSAAPAGAGPRYRIASAGLAFLWQLARRNPYAARLVCGASLGWCEQLAACTLLHVLECAVIDPCLVRPRLAPDEIFWQRLLGPALSSEPAVRRAARLCAMQAILQPDSARPGRNFRSAACRSTVPSLQLHERSTPKVR